MNESIQQIYIFLWEKMAKKLQKLQKITKNYKKLQKMTKDYKMQKKIKNTDLEAFALMSISVLEYSVFE